MANIKIFVCEECDPARVFHSAQELGGHQGRLHSKRVQELKPIDHGTPLGARAHRRRGEKPCTACRMAWAIYVREHRQVKGR